ncbi:hypothetical protein CSIM01_09548 [Colletotrichum simmondsii]|uniref:Secreted protein n=1 Tax=Colletotrichum simmondsii TaxID=703756 RepID=A0A135T346_9PEZI|nr:hypothetical protein CSIM01_09548 [Colletotrichum simmondsii]
MALIHALYGLLALPVACHAKAPEYSPVDDRGTFESPAVKVRPKFRYWLPDASVDIDTFSDDIAQIGQRGAGGIELLNYFNYGGAQGPPPEEVDWNVYGYATPAYRQVLEAALQATKDGGLIMDFAMGPQSGQGVPAEPDEVGLSWELVTFNATFTGNFDGQIPGWGSGDFVSLSTFDVVGTRIVTGLAQRPANKTEYVVSASSLTDLTDKVSSDGSISVSPSSMGSNSSFLFASYARRSYARAAIATSQDPQNFLQNGSFAVDHFSPAGARLTTSFLEAHIITSNSSIRSLFKDVGQYIWEDSVEVPAPTYWTPELLTRFRQQHNYDLLPYVPLLVGFNGDLMLDDPPISIVSDDPQHATIVDDYRSTMTSLYKEYLTAMGDWVHDYLGLEFSAQVGYNLPVDMLSSIPYVDVPETETLAFLNNIDGFRQFSGAANLANQKIISIELGADFGQTYSQTLATIIEESSRAYAVGVNQIVIHGAAYSGSYPQTTYPGFASFGYTFGGQHSRHQPAWDLGYEQMLDWLARTQFVLQSGTPKVDLVFWDKQAAQDPFPESLYKDIDLSDAGYSYTYLSPDNFALPQAVVGDGVLAPSTLGAKALVLRQNDTLTLFGVEKLAEYAGVGLPIIIQGNLPTRFSTNNASGVASATATLRSIVSLPNVHQTHANASSSGSSPTGLIPILTTLGLKPRTAIRSSGVWYTRYLSSSSDGTTSVFIFSDSTNATEGTINIDAIGVPMMLDLWNGAKSRIPEYKIDGQDGTITLSLNLAAKQAIIIHFDDTEDPTSIHVTDAPKEVLGYVSDCSDSIVAKIGALPAQTNQITLSDNTTIKLDSFVGMIPAAFNLSNWTLIAEKWVPPTNISNLEGVVKTNITLNLPGEVLMSWTAIEGLVNTSGIGLYSNSFTWNFNDTSLGAYLKIPAAGVVQGMSVSINGRSLPNVDIFAPMLDITEFLTPGKIVLEVRVSTTLWNSLRPIWTQLRTGGIKPEFTIESLLASPRTAFLAAEQAYGLVGAVQIIPYTTLKIT